MRSFVHVIEDPQGLHARSCVMLSREAAKWKSEVRVRTAGRVADAKSLSSLLSLKAVFHDQLAVCCSGEDEVDAASALEALMRMSL